MNRFPTQKWKALVQKFKIKDNGLLKALGTYENLRGDQYYQRLKVIDSITVLAGALKGAKEVANVGEAVDLLDEMLDASKSEKKSIEKASESRYQQRHAHHLLPQQYRPEFEAAGFKIDELLVNLTKTKHKFLHHMEGWNQMWEQFLGERGGRIDKVGDVDKFVTVLCKTFEIQKPTPKIPSKKAAT